MPLQLVGPQPDAGVEPGNYRAAHERIAGQESFGFGGQIGSQEREHLRVQLRTSLCKSCELTRAFGRQQRHQAIE